MSSAKWKTCHEEQKHARLLTTQHAKAVTQTFSATFFFNYRSYSARFGTKYSCLRCKAFTRANVWHQGQCHQAQCPGCHVLAPSAKGHSIAPFQEPKLLKWFSTQMTTLRSRRGAAPPSHPGAPPPPRQHHPNRPEARGVHVRSPASSEAWQPPGGDPPRASTVGPWHHPGQRKPSHELQHTSWKVMSVTIGGHVPLESHKNVEFPPQKNKNVKTVQIPQNLACIKGQGHSPQSLKTTVRSAAPFTHDHRTKWSLANDDRLSHQVNIKRSMTAK